MLMFAREGSSCNNVCLFIYFDPMAVVTELLGRPALHEYANKANKLKLNNMLKL